MQLGGDISARMETIKSHPIFIIIGIKLENPLLDIGKELEIN